MLAAAAILLLAASGGGCGGDATTPPSATSDGVGSAPEPGQAVIEQRAGGLLLLARDAPRRSILHELSSRYGFALEEYAPADPLVRVSLVDVSLEEALEILLEGTPHRIEYELDPYDAQGGIVRVVVGTDPDDEPAS